MNTLYWAPHTCAIGIHILLEEIGAPYRAEKLEKSALAEPEFLRINPKGKVPTLRRGDGTVLTEFGVIAYWLASTHPEAGLLPADKEDETRGAEMMEYAIGTVHAQGFARMFMPQRFEPKDLLHKAGLGAASVKREGHEMAEEAFAILERALGGRPYAGGANFGIFDAALFYCERWAAEVDLVLPPGIASHFERVRARPAVRRVLDVWGEAPV